MTNPIQTLPASWRFWIKIALVGALGAFASHLIEQKIKKVTKT